VALTAKQAAFVREYLVDLNATQAAIRAGYSKKTANVIASELLAKPNIQSAIQEEMKKRAERTEITADKVLKEFAKLAFFDPRKLFDDKGNPKDITELDDDTAAALAGLDVVQDFDPDTGVTSYTKKYKLASKQAALDSLGRHLGMFLDRTEVNASVAVTMESYLEDLDNQGEGQAF
jgi:terminase small subunit